MIVKKVKLVKKEKVQKVVDVVDDGFVILGQRVMQNAEDKKLCEIQKMIKERIKNKYDYRFRKA